jgi:pimeloyl-ACP methyl ester carboxylesterase
MPKVKVGDINMYYEVHGRGEPLVMIPGFASGIGGFFMHVPVFSRNYRVVTVDNRGAGRSDAPDVPYTMEMMADDLAGLLDAIGTDSAHIWGSSMGGSIAQQFALRHPKKVKRLILACASCGGPHSVITTDSEIIASFQPSELPPKEAFRKKLPLLVSQQYIDKNKNLITQIIDNWMNYPASPQGQARHTQATIANDTYEKLPEIRVPTLVIHGDADRVVPVENARILASRIPGAELAILKKMGHLFMFEAFNESNRIMLDFLRRHRIKKAA